MTVTREPAPRLIIILFILLLSTRCFALERFETLSTAELQSLLERREKNQIDFLLVNTLDTMIANHHSLPGSENIPWPEVSTHATLLKRDKNLLIVTYCMGFR